MRYCLITPSRLYIILCTIRVYAMMRRATRDVTRIKKKNCILNRRHTYRKVSMWFGTTARIFQREMRRGWGGEEGRSKTVRQTSSAESRVKRHRHAALTSSEVCSELFNQPLCWRTHKSKTRGLRVVFINQILYAYNFYPSVHGWLIAVPVYMYTKCIYYCNSNSFGFW